MEYPVHLVQRNTRGIILDLRNSMKRKPTLDGIRRRAVTIFSGAESKIAWIVDRAM